MSFYDSSYIDEMLHAISHNLSNTCNITSQQISEAVVGNKNLYYINKLYVYTYYNTRYIKYSKMMIQVLILWLVNWVFVNITRLMSGYDYSKNMTLYCCTNNYFFWTPVLFIGTVKTIPVIPSQIHQYYEPYIST